MQQEHFEARYPASTRDKEISELLTFVKEGNSCQLIGIPGAGRSTLLSMLAHNRQIRIKQFGEQQKAVHFVLANFSEMRKRPLIDVMKFLFLLLTESLRERRMFVENKAVGDIFREHLKFHDELILFQGFKEAIDYLCLEKQITVVFLFDRFEEYLPTVTEDFFTNLRTLRNRAKYKFSVIFSTYRPLETFLESGILADFYEFVAGHIVYLPISDDDTTLFRVQYIEKITGRTVPKDVLNEIISLAGGTGRLIKLSVEAVLATGSVKKSLSEFLLQQKTIKTALAEIWSVLTPAEQTAIMHKQFNEPEVVSYLEHVGLLHNHTLQIPLLEAFLQEQEQTYQPTGAIIFDVHTNTIKRGEEVLSDHLTGSEFRLLRFFLTNPDRIVEREELLTAVWEDNKSTAGITDQAIDQLIFRLRRKIEADANNPTHLQTVKGRGFRFLP